MSDIEGDVSRSADRSLTLADIMSAIQSSRSETSNMEARLSQRIGQRSDEVLALVTEDVNRVRDQLQAETLE